MMAIPSALLDADTLSEVMKGRDVHGQSKARQGLATLGRFRVFILTRDKIRRLCGS
jgi:hypothetical protein